jgi:hypothetical protein
MSKNLLQDMVSKDGKSIRHITLPERKKSSRTVAGDYQDLKYVKESGKKMVSYNQSSKKWVWFAAFIAVLGLAFAINSVFTGAQVIVTPKSEPISVDLTLRAVKESLLGELTYQTATITKTGREVVVADGEKKTDKRATGTIIIFNNFSSTAQRLIKNTRFETSTGLVYRIDSSVVVPGKTSKDGKAVPGSVEASVTADSIGTQYNISLTDFTLPAFKDDSARFTGFYGRSKTAMTGGFSGVMKYVSNEKLIQAKTKIHQSLEKSLIDQAKAEVPVGFILYDTAYTISFESLPNEELADNGVAINEKAVFTAFLLNKDQLAITMAKKSLPIFDGKPVQIPGMESFNFILEKDSKNLTSGTPVNFQIKGTAKVVWLYDTASLKTALAGKSKSDLKTILAPYTGIEKAEMILRPFWKSHFPDTTDRIEVTESKEESQSPK